MNKFNKGISTLIGIIIIIAMAVIAVGGVFVYQYFTTQKQQNQNQQINNIQSKDQIADWQTYKNDKYGFGFEIKYPNTLYLKDNNIAPAVVYFEEIKYKNEEPTHRPSITIEAITTSLTPREWVVKNSENTIQLQDGKKTPIEDAVIGSDNLPAIKFYSAPASGSSNHTVIKVNGNLLLDISLNNSPNGDIESDVYEKMLSTFIPKDEKDFSTIIQGQCWNYDSQLSEESILEIKLTIDKKDTITLGYLDYIEVGAGRPSLFQSKGGGEYSLKVLDKTENILYERKFQPGFFRLSDPPTPIDASSIFDEIKYSSLMYKVEVFRKDKLLFSHKIGNVCDCDYRCEPGETYFSCPVDCESWAEDGICSGEYDGVCDLDCISGDVDCEIQKENNKE